MPLVEDLNQNISTIQGAHRLGTVLRHHSAGFIKTHIQSKHRRSRSYVYELTLILAAMRTPFRALPKLDAHNRKSPSSAICGGVHQ
jgi:hypothetical protein